MRAWSLAVLAVLFLAGCSSPGNDGGSPADLALDAGAEPGAAVAAGNSTLSTMRFAGGDQESQLTFSETFAQTDGCILGFPDCPASSQRFHDLLDAVPASVPVELSITADQDASINMYLETTEATLLFYHAEFDAQQSRLDALLVRAPSGTVGLRIYLNGISADPAGTTVEIVVHSVSRAAVVPAYVPVMVQLAPGDVINATGDGLEQLVIFPPAGPALRAVDEPFEIRIPDNLPEGPYYILAAADEAVRLRGPPQTMMAHLLVFEQTEAKPLQGGQEVTWELTPSGYPVNVGMAFETQDTVPGFFSTGSFNTAYQLKLVAPGNVEVVLAEDDCFPICGGTVIGRYSFFYSSGFLEEHLVPGAYQASATMDAGNGMQAYAWSVSIQ